MRISIGRGGWVRVASGDHPLSYVRFGRTHSGRWVVTELYVVSDEDGPIRMPSLRSLPLSDLEAFANGAEVSPYLDAHAGYPGPDLRRAASHFATGWTKPTHWVAESQLANFPRSGVKQAPMGKEPERYTPPSGTIPRLETPPEGLTDDFLREVARAYEIAVNRGEHPAPAIAATSGVSVSAVRKWVYVARRRKIMPAGQQGRVG